jgi:hypothetical protein
LPDGKKEIQPITKTGAGWANKHMPTPRPLYRLPELAGASIIPITEGEKCADAARKLGFTATTSSGGAKAPKQTDWTPLAGKTVWILPDNDKPGRDYASVVTTILSKLTPPAVVKIIALPGLGDGGDIVDWIGAHGDAAEPESMRAEIETLAAAATVPRPSNQQTRIEFPDPAVEPDAPELSTYQPFPLAALPQPVRDYVDAESTALGVDPAFSALPLIPVMAGAIGNSRQLRLKTSWKEPAIIWTTIIGESGTGKSPGIDGAKKFPDRRQRAAFKRHQGPLAEYKAELARCKKKGLPRPDPPVCDRCLVDDTTIEALAPILANNWRGVVIVKDELAAWVNSFDRYAAKGRQGAEAAKWIEMFGGRPVIIDRKNESAPVIYVARAAVSIGGGIQPGVLRRVISQEYRDNGLLARLLLAWPPRQAKRWLDCDVDVSLVRTLGAAYDRLFELAPGQDEDGDPAPKLVTMTPDAKTLFIDFVNKHGIEQTDLDGDLAAAWSKLEGYAARLALVHHLTRWATGGVADDGLLDADSMSAGIELSRWFANEARRVYAGLEETDQERETAELCKLIQERGGTISPRDLARATRKYRQTGKAEEALGRLEKKQLGKWFVLPPTQGRPGRVFQLWER